MIRRLKTIARNTAEKGAKSDYVDGELKKNKYLSVFGKCVHILKAHLYDHSDENLFDVYIEARQDVASAGLQIVQNLKKNNIKVLSWISGIGRVKFGEEHAQRVKGNQPGDYAALFTAKVPSTSLLRTRFHEVLMHEFLDTTYGSTSEVQASALGRIADAENTTSWYVKIRSEDSPAVTDIEYITVVRESVDISSIVMDQILPYLGVDGASIDAEHEFIEVGKFKKREKLAVSLRNYFLINHN